VAAQDWAGLRTLPEQGAVLDTLSALRDATGRASLTVLLLGKSGVGKSSLVNALLGEKAAAVSAFKLQADTESTVKFVRQVRGPPVSGGCQALGAVAVAARKLAGARRCSMLREAKDAADGCCSSRRHRSIALAATTTFPTPSYLIQVAVGDEGLDGFRLTLIDTCGLEDPEAGDTVSYGVSGRDGSATPARANARERQRGRRQLADGPVGSAGMTHWQRQLDLSTGSQHMSPKQRPLTVYQTHTHTHPTATHPINHRRRSSASPRTSRASPSTPSSTATGWTCTGWSRWTRGWVLCIRWLVISFLALGGVAGFDPLCLFSIRLQRL
jgi:hypothetical protein